MQKQRSLSIAMLSIIFSSLVMTLLFQNCANNSFEADGAYTNASTSTNVDQNSSVVQNSESSTSQINVPTATTPRTPSSGGSGTPTPAPTPSTGGGTTPIQTVNCENIHMDSSYVTGPFWKPIFSAYEKAGFIVNPDVLDPNVLAKVLIDSKCTYKSIVTVLGHQFAQSIAGYVGWTKADIAEGTIVPKSSLYSWAKPVTDFSGPLFDIKLSPMNAGWAMDGPLSSPQSSYDRFVMFAAGSHYATDGSVHNFKVPEKYLWINPGARPISRYAVSLFKSEDAWVKMLNDLRGVLISSAYNPELNRNQSCYVVEKRGSGAVIVSGETDPQPNTNYENESEASSHIREIHSTQPNATILVGGMNIDVNGYEYIPTTIRGTTDGMGIFTWNPCSGSACKSGVTYRRYFMILNPSGQIVCTTSHVWLRVK